MNDDRPIPIPLPLLLRRFRYQVLPVLTLLLASSLAAWIWAKRGLTAHVVGEVNYDRVTVNAKMDGVLAALPGDREFVAHDTVSKGETVARFDKTALEAEMGRLMAENDRMREELDLMTRQVPRSGGRPTTAPSSPESNGGGATGEATVESAVGAMDIDLSNLPPHLLQPASTLRVAIAANEARIRELETLVQDLDVKAPIGGTITLVQRRPGQAVKAGDPILSIASDKAQYIVGYVRQGTIQPRVGGRVDVRSRTTFAVHRSRITSVGPQVELVPEHQLRDVKFPEWGTPVHIELPAGANFKPGELVDLVFLPDFVSSPSRSEATVSAKGPM